MLTLVGDGDGDGEMKTVPLIWYLVKWANAMPATLNVNKANLRGFWTELPRVLKH